MAEALGEIPYRGTCTVELAYEGKTARTRSLEENLKRSLDFVRAVILTRDGDHGNGKGGVRASAAPR